MHRIVVKVGSNVLTRDDGGLDVTRMSSLVDQIAQLHRTGVEVLLVTSGAVASGRGTLRPEHSLDSVEQRQLYSAVGQVQLINRYSLLFREWGILIGQVLTTKSHFESEVEYSNQRACMEVMLANGVIPVINENDTVCVTELMFTDNDELSGLVARMMEADLLVILSNVDGLYSSYGQSGKVISVVHPGEDVSSHIGSGRSSAGRGGMASKCGTAMEVSAHGIPVAIACGRRDNVLLDLVNNPESVPHTLFAVE